MIHRRGCVGGGTCSDRSKCRTPEPGRPAGSSGGMRRVAVERSNLRWCSDGFEIGCDNGEKVRVASLSTAIVQPLPISPRPKASRAKTCTTSSSPPSKAATDRSIAWRKRSSGSPKTIGYIACETRAMARDIGLEPRTTPGTEPAVKRHAEAFVGHEARLHPHLTLPDARTVMENLPLWIERYNTLHPHKALGYRSPCEFIAEQTQP